MSPICEVCFFYFFGDVLNKKGMATIKCLFVGEYGSGKSALLRRIVDDVFEVTTPTVGVEFHLIEMPGVEHRITAWNLAGAPRFQDILSLYYKDSIVIFIVIDASVPTNIGKWVHRAEKLCRDAKIVLVFTKVDLKMHYSTFDIEFMKSHYRSVFDSCMVSSKEMSRREILATIGKVFRTVQPRESCLNRTSTHNDHRGTSLFCCFM